MAGGTSINGGVSEGDLMGGPDAGAQPGQRPVVMLLGPEKSGKSSVKRVVFHRLPSHETMYLRSTMRPELESVDHSPFLQFDILDMPGTWLRQVPSDPAALGSLDKMPIEAVAASDGTEEVVEQAPPVVMRTTVGELFRRPGFIVYVVDVQSAAQLSGAVEGLIRVLTIAQALRITLQVEVCLHKSEDAAAGPWAEGQGSGAARLRSHFLGQVRTQGLGGAGSITFHNTSIHDHSVFDAFSKALQRLLRPLAHLQGLLDGMVSKCSLKKAFLYDALTKLHFASDYDPADEVTYQLCSDILDVAVDINCIYGAAAGEEPEAEDAEFDSKSSATIRLSDQSSLLLRWIAPYTALVAMVEAPVLRGKEGLLERNIEMLREATRQVMDWDVGAAAAGGAGTPPGGDGDA